MILQTGVYEGMPIYADIPDDEYRALEKAGFTPKEIEQFYKTSDPYRG